MERCDVNPVLGTYLLTWSTSFVRAVGFRLRRKGDDLTSSEWKKTAKHFDFAATFVVNEHRTGLNFAQH